MKYIAKYNRFVNTNGEVFYKMKNGDIVKCEQSISKAGYCVINCKVNGCWKVTKVHRIIFEAFVHEIPENMVIDHINAIKTDNRLENLRCVSQKENLNNPLSIKANSEAHKGKPAWNKGKTTSEFGRKFYEHFGMFMSDDVKLYTKESRFYHTHNKKCSWED